MGIILWIIFGALAGWLASLLMNTDASQGALGNIVVGILGAVIGGFIMSNLGFGGIDGFNIYSLLVAIGGAVVLTFIVQMIRGSNRTQLR